MAAFLVAVQGAESTGKTTLCAQLAGCLRRKGLSAVVVPETLRDFCDREGRTPREDEQAALAAAHHARIETAAASPDAQVVIADTTSLTIAVYSEVVFGDRSLYGQALERQQRFDLNLLTALDLPWVEDGFVRDGPHVREPVDALLRSALSSIDAGYSLVHGSGEARLRAALAIVEHGLQVHRHGRVPQTWQWRCPDCDEPRCERHLFKGLPGWPGD
jgi:nicotinamide riboside kinase